MSHASSGKKVNEQRLREKADQSDHRIETFTSLESKHLPRPSVSIITKGYPVNGDAMSPKTYRSPYMRWLYAVARTYYFHLLLLLLPHHLTLSHSQSHCASEWMGIVISSFPFIRSYPLLFHSACLFDRKEGISAKVFLPLSFSFPSLSCCYCCCYLCPFSSIL
jgi:hypothetical protein